MSYKVLQLSPHASTDGIQMRIASQDAWSPLVPGSRDISFLPSRVEDEAHPDEAGTLSLNWGTVSGLALAVTVSASFWAGVAFIVTRLWK
ncbi:MAG: hypothetical protein WCA27_27060 [Candidatus Sulfotelmatobacter sp.]